MIMDIYLDLITMCLYIPTDTHGFVCYYFLNMEAIKKKIRPSLSNIFFYVFIFYFLYLKNTSILQMSIK